MLEHVLGEDGAIECNETTLGGDKYVKIIKLCGPVADLESVTLADWCPEGYYVESSTLTPDGDGLGTLEIRCVECPGIDDTKILTTYRVEMTEVALDLIQHPDLKGNFAARAWLETDEAKRYDEVEDKFYYADKDGNLVEIKSEDLAAIRFCRAYMAGIRTFNRYYPVIERVSLYKKPKGMSGSGFGTFTGNPEFSSCGSFEAPPLELTGYAQTNWFKSKDSWAQSSDRTWTRTEQWTYTPEGSTGAYSWIYA